ncbi:MAG: lysophospholipid acyltransferase family protein [Lentisphaerota bacterium]
MAEQEKMNVKRGNNFGFIFFHFVLRTAGLKHARRMAAVICVYYLLFDWGAIKRAMPYVRRLKPDAGFFKHMAFIYRIFVNQAWILLDRAAFNDGLISFDPASTGYETFAGLAEQHATGVVLLGAHFGNWQLASEGLKKLGCRINIVMSPETNPAVKTHLKINSAAGNIAYIFTDGPDHGCVEIASALCAGEVVCLMGDRAYGADTVGVQFLGETAGFPYSAWIIAAKTSSAVIPFFVCKHRDRGYHVRCDDPVYPVLERGQAVAESVQPLVQQYVRSLEEVICEYPEQCFIFSDVWKR